MMPSPQWKKLAVGAVRAAGEITGLSNPAARQKISLNMLTSITLFFIFKILRESASCVELQGNKQM